jgi:hypothetical protein
VVFSGVKASRLKSKKAAQLPGRLGGRQYKD